jgi:RNA polymerase sigma-B factor
LARRLSTDPHQLDDLIQVGYVGLMQAIDRFDPGRGTPFLAFAVPTILGEMRRYLRDGAPTVRVPRHLGADGGGRGDVVVSLDDEKAGRGSDLSLRDTLGADDAEMTRSEDRATIVQILRSLSPRERIVLYLRFYEGLPQSEVARRMGVSQMHVSRLEHRALEKVKRFT